MKFLSFFVKTEKLFSIRGFKAFLPFFLGISFFIGAFGISYAIPSYYYERFFGPSTRASFLEADKATGALIETIPIEIPPGREGVQPDLSLVYNSQDARKDDIVGYGWSLSIPYIERFNKTGTDHLYSSNYFTSSLDGELVQIGTSTQYRAKVDNGDFRTYSYSNDIWTVTDKRGTIYTFGSATTTRQDDPGDSSRIYKWMVDDIRDTNDNFVRFEYSKDSGQIYPLRIVYTGNGAADGIFEIEFTLQARNDDPTIYSPGFGVTSAYRVSEIKTEISNSWVRKYTLVYTTGDNGARSLLASITEEGRDELGNITTLPATAFSYQKPSTYDYGWTDPEWNSPIDFRFGVHLADANGDALADIVEASKVTSGASHDRREVYANTGSGWSEDTAWQFPYVYFYRENETPESQGTRIIDIDGDGLADLTKSIAGVGGGAWRNIGDAWATSSELGSPMSFDFSNNNVDYGTRFVELNGDNLIDYARTQASGENIVTESYTGGAQGGSASWEAPVDFRYGVYVFDANGDGLDDLVEAVYKTSGTSIDRRAVYLNTGSEWVEDESWIVPDIYFWKEGFSGQQGVRVMDLNGDGLLDIVQGQSGSGAQSGAYINTGSGWATSSTWGTPMAFAYTNNTVDYGARIADINGDGLLDAVHALDEGGGVVTSIAVNTGSKADLLTKITYNTGAFNLIEYQPTAFYTSTSSIPLNPDLPFAVETVKKIERNDGFATSTSNEYSYEGGLFYYDNPLDRKFAGFSKITDTDRAGNFTRTYFHQGTSTNSSQGEFNDHPSKIGKPYRVEVYNSSGELLSKTINKWENVDLNNDADFVKLTQTLDFAYDGDGDHKDKAETYAYSTTTGNLTEKIEWGEVVGSDDGSISDVGSDKRTTAISYATDGAFIIGLPSQETITNQGGGKVRETRHYYDGLSLGNVDEGNETKTEEWKVSSSYIDTEFVYNGYGLVATSTDPLGNSMSYLYDQHNLYPATTTDAVGNVTGRAYDYSSGKVRLTIDPNGLVFETTYDGLDRPLAEKQPDIQTPSTLVTKKSYSYTDTVGSRKIVETNQLDGSIDFTLYTYLDGLDRKVQTRKEAETSNEFSVKDFAYDNRGLLQKESLPYFSSGTSKTTPTTDVSLYSTQLYDALNRVSAVGTAVGTTTYAYDQWTATTTDAKGNAKGLLSDAFGNLSKVIEKEGSNYYITSYIYDAADNLATITDADGNVRNFTYDGLGQRLTAQDLHDSGDVTYGTTTYAYDDAGNLSSQTDPKGQTIEFTYDYINRVLTEDYMGQGGTEITYGYDTCTYGKPRLCVATSTGAVTAYTYNSLGLASIETRTIDSTGYTTSYDYDRQGNLTGITYPDESEVAYAYNTAGLLETVQFKESGGSFANVLSDIDYAPTEKVTYKLFGNDVQSTYTYDATQLYRLTNIFTVSSTTEEGMGGMGFFDDIWSTLALAAEPMPLAVQHLLLDNAGDISVEEVSTRTEPSTAEETKVVIEEATTTPAEAELATIEIATTTPHEAEPLEDTALNTFVPEENSAREEFTLEPQPSQVIPVPDTQTGPYADKGDRYELPISSRLQNVGEAKIELMKEHPGVRLTKWNGEVNLGVSYQKVKAHALYVASNDHIQWKSEGEEVHAYPLPAKEGMEDGGFEVEIYLKEPPGTNVFEFTLDGTENLDFFYQSALTQEEIEQGASAPENVIGSFAVYHKTKNGYRVGNLNYATGKAFHIYRPKAIDSSGNETWGELSYANNVLSVTVPQEFLDKAAYPVRVDPTFGYTSLGGFSDTIADNFSDDNERVGHAETLAEAGTLDSLHAGLELSTTLSGNQTVSIKVFLNDENTATDSHDEVAAVEEDKTITSTSPAWFTFTANSESLPADSYILNIVGDGSDLGSLVRAEVAYDSTGTRNNYYEDFTGTYASAKESPWTETDSSSSKRYSIYATYTATSSNQAPTAPTSLQAEGQTDPTDITDSTPEFTAVYNDPDSGDNAVFYKIQVATTTSFASTYWDSGKAAMATTTQGSTTPNISYAGSALASSTTYYWRIKLWDDSDAEGAWSTATSTFSLAASGGGGGGQFSTILQNISYIYDSVGNITNITDYSDTGAGKTVEFRYDDFYRLTFASTTVASSTPFKQTFEYNSLGNITGWKTDTSATSTYAYAETGYANPHAATSIGGVAYSYDNNGNTTGAGSWAYGWDYRNRLSSAGSGSATSTYAYDHGNQRVKKTSSGITTAYPNKYFNTTGATTTNHIFTPSGDLLASVELVSSGGGGTATSTGLKSPSATGGTYNEWTSPTNAYASDNSDATGDSSRTTSDEQDYYNFGFSVPSGATIDGIEVSIEGESDERLTSDPVGTYTSNIAVRLSWDGGSNWTSWDQKNGIFPNDSGVDTIEVWGSATGTWGRSWSDSEFTNANFRIHLDNVSGGYRGSTFFDHVRAKIYYTTSGGGATTTATTTSYIHGDHLGGMNVSSDQNGLATEIVDFLPYGAERFRDGDSQDQRQFTGYEYDDESNLHYANARYYNQDIGKFLSQDPLFQNLGADRRTERVLQDPQLQNSYSYARNNPLTLVDPNGEEPIKSQLGTASDIQRVLQHADKIYQGSSRSEQLGGLQTVISVNSARYIYTTERGWIDTQHFFEAAKNTQIAPGALVRIGGFLFEGVQALTPSYRSSFSYEDLPSNKAGTEFGNLVKGNENSLAEAFGNYMKSIGATTPTDAPNFDTISDRTVNRVEGANFSSDPIKKQENTKK